MKKIIMLATMAVAAMAFAVPSVASASGHFFHEGAPIEEGTKELKLTGRIAFGSENGGVSCVAHPEATIGTTSGTLNNLNITTNTCIYTGIFQHCELTEHFLTSGTGVNTLTPTSEETDIDLKNFKLFNKFKTAAGESAVPCGVAGLPLELTFSNITLTPDNHEAISEVTATGSGVLEVVGGPVIAEITAEGSLEAAEGFAGTIGLTEF